LRIKNCSKKTIFSLQASKFVEIEALSVSLTPGADIGALRYLISGAVKYFPDLPINKRLELHGIDPEFSARTICVQLPCDYSQVNDKDMYLTEKKKFYKTFSEKPLNEVMFDKIFESGYSIEKSVPWLAYPKYKQEAEINKVIPSVFLDSEDRSRILYLNSLEWSASCMEICSISARNAANLIWKNENKSRKKENQLDRGGSFFYLNEKNKMKRFLSENDYKENNFGKNLHRMCGLVSFVLLFSFILAQYNY
jgi:hypothetical protein